MHLNSLGSLPNILSPAVFKNDRMKNLQISVQVLPKSEFLFINIIFINIIIVIESILSYSKVHRARI